MISACIVICAASLTAAQQSAATDPASVQAPSASATLTALMRNSTEDQRVRMFRVIRRHYPT